MRVIIAGGRDIFDFQRVVAAIHSSGWYYQISSVVSGDADGVDALGAEWANLHFIPVAHYPAKWRDLNVPGAVIRYDKNGRPYNAKAGYDRNRLMAQNADALILVWSGKSKGSKMMKEIAEEYKLPIYEAKG